MTAVALCSCVLRAVQFVPVPPVFDAVTTPFVGVAVKKKNLFVSPVSGTVWVRVDATTLHFAAPIVIFTETPVVVPFLTFSVIEPVPAAAASLIVIEKDGTTSRPVVATPIVGSVPLTVQLRVAICVLLCGVGDVNVIVLGPHDIVSVCPSTVNSTWFVTDVRSGTAPATSMHRGTEPATTATVAATNLASRNRGSNPMTFLQSACTSPENSWLETRRSR